jgi:hypothetical protein
MLLIGFVHSKLVVTKETAWNLKEESLNKENSLRIKRI